RCAAKRSSSTASARPATPARPTDVPRPRLALVPGEPAGVGPELCVRLAQRPRPDHSLLAHGDAATLREAADRLGLPLRLRPADAVADAPGDLPVVDIPNAVPVVPGRPDPRNARAVVDALLAGADACLRGTCDGLVTGPVHKATID